MVKRRKNRSRRKRTAICLTAAVMVLSGLPQIGCAGNVKASEAADDLLIEDFGEEIVDNSGADLDALKESERREAELAAEAEEAAREEAMQEVGVLLEAADPDLLQQHMDSLTEADSPIGSDGELICAAYIEEIMEQYGYTISEQNFHEGFLNENGVDAPGINIIAERGADARERTDDIFIIATHYDSKTNPSGEDPFANDKTGAAALLELARILSCVETDTDICFVFFSGEEDGLYGSAKFVEFMQEDFAHRVAGVLYVELVGYTSEEVYLLKTLDGCENCVGNLVKEAALNDLLTQPVETGEALGQEAAEEESGEVIRLTEREDWIWVEDQKTSQYSFAVAGMDAVTVSQDVLGEYAACENNGAGGLLLEDSEMKQQETETEQQDGGVKKAEVNMNRLAAVTDILAACVGEVMN